MNAWFSKYENPLKDVMLKVRQIILSSDPRMEECIKWSGPTFTYKGNLASFNPRSKKHASLMFHTATHIPGKFSNLKGEGITARFMTFLNLDEVKSRKKWCKFKDGGKDDRICAKNNEAYRNYRTQLRA